MSIGCKLIADPSNTEYRTVIIASQAYTVGDLVDLDRSGPPDVVPSTLNSITPAIYGVSMSTQLSTDTSMLICLLTPLQRWSVDSTNTPNIAHNSQRMVVGATARIINNTGTDVTGDTGVFQQLGIAAGTNRLVGRFLPGVNNA